MKSGQMNEERPQHETCPECRGNIDADRSRFTYVDQYALATPVPDDMHGRAIHYPCWRRMILREEKRLEIEVLTEAIVAACARSPLKEMIESLRARLETP